MKKEIQTRKNEEITSTLDSKKMFGKYLSENIVRRWDEDFHDEDTGEIISIERKEILFSAGTYVDNDIIPKIRFYIESGDIKVVKLSNQRREARFVRNSFTHVWSVNVQVGKKKVKLLLYANSIDMALEVAKDFIELNYSGLCYTLQVKEFGSYIMIEDNLKRDDESENDSDSGKKFYKIETKIIQDENIHYHSFVVLSTDVDASMIVINNWLSKALYDKENNTLVDFSTVIESAVVIPCNHIIDKEFSEAYLEEEAR